MLFGGEGIVLLKLLGLYCFPFFFPTLALPVLTGRLMVRIPVGAGQLFLYPLPAVLGWEQ